MAQTKMDNLDWSVMARDSYEDAIGLESCPNLGWSVIATVKIQCTVP